MIKAPFPAVKEAPVCPDCGDIANRNLKPAYCYVNGCNQLMKPITHVVIDDRERYVGRGYFWQCGGTLDNPHVQIMGHD